ncbi:MAG TPA: LapA family protein [Candidatus Paceibacterota bacterium]|nr:LapA family protein [Candidatus Paceibacterota bacterium]
MIFFLILGVLLGAISIIFILQNVEPVTVSFFAYHLSGSLALILFLALFAGVIITILILLPSFVADSFLVSRLRKQNKALEDELIATKQSLHQVATTPTVAEDTITTVV